MPRLLSPILISLFCLLTLGLAGQPSQSSAQQGAHKAGIIIQFPDKSTQTYCIEFEADTITGLDLLLKTGLDVKVEVQGLGALVCAIGSTGCDYPAQACVCQSYGPNGVYWVYSHLKDGKFRASITGAGTYKVSPGDVEGWAWGGGTQPPVYTFNQICAIPEAPAPTPGPPAPPTDTPAPPPSATPPPPLPPTITPNPLPTKTQTHPSPTQEIQQPPATAPEPTSQPPTQQPAIQTATPPANTATSTPATAPTNTTTPTASAIPLPTNTNAPTPTLTTTPTATPQQAPATSTDTARTLGLLISGGVVAALIVWGALTFLPRRKTPNSDRGQN